ncbi:MAG TPA: DUF5658 family protein [Pyrinomonadaceae bacterium]|nr:DUF5658 family protein [Pyrinomonadaceae bacterium]
MSALTKCLLLFMLNWLDAQLTIVWVRNGLATEGNGLMAYLLDAGNVPFLATKLIVGAGVAFILYRWSHLAVARRGLRLVLGLYCALMFVHAATGIAALGWPQTDAAIAYLVSLPDALLAMMF